MTFRYDHGSLNKYDTLPNGSIRVWGTIAQIGWLKYFNNDGSLRYEYVDKDTLFDPRHLDSIAGSAVTLHHPKEKITPGNYKKYAVGQTGTKIIKREDLGTIEIVTVIGDEEAINSVRNRDATCLSEAYDCIVKPFHQHFKQFSRLCNHNSLVPLGRANKAKLHLDSSDSFLYGFHVDDSEVDRVILPTLQSIKFTPRSEV